MKRLTSSLNWLSGSQSAVQVVITGTVTTAARLNGTARREATLDATSGGLRENDTEGGESVCIQCVNRKKLTFAKAEEDNRQSSQCTSRPAASPSNCYRPT